MDEMTMPSAKSRLETAVDLVSAYFSRNHIQPAELPTLIADVHKALTGLDAPSAAEEASPEKLTAAQIRKSITPDHLISFEDGKPYKALKRHLTRLDLTPDAYRAKWGLPADYPMTATNYSAQRSALAQAIGLGQIRKKAAPAPEPTPEPANDITSEKPKRAGRPRKVKEEA